MYHFWFKKTKSASSSGHFVYLLAQHGYMVIYKRGGGRGVVHPVNRLIFVPNPDTDKGILPQNPFPPILAPKITGNRLNFP